MLAARHDDDDDENEAPFNGGFHPKLEYFDNNGININEHNHIIHDNYWMNDTNNSNNHF